MKYENILENLMEIGPNKYVSKRDPYKLNKMYKNGIKTPFLLLQLSEAYYKRGDYKKALYFKREALALDKDGMFTDQINAIEIPMEGRRKMEKKRKWWKGPLLVLPWLLILFLIGINIKTYRHIIKADTMTHSIVYNIGKSNVSHNLVPQEIIVDENMSPLEIPTLAEKLIDEDPSKEYYFLIKRNNGLEPLAYAKKTSDGIITEIKNAPILKKQESNTNLLKNALKIYKDDHGQYPKDMENLVEEKYLDTIPKEPFSNINAVNENQDNRGGWVYNPDLIGNKIYSSDKEELDQLLRPNVAGTDDGALGYEPMIIEIHLNEQKLKLIRGENVEKEYDISSGKDDAKTPEGEFKITKKYKLSPDEQKQSTNVPYGAGVMALSIKNYAIHGTNEPEKIGTAVSNGCIRMKDEDFNDLYDVIPNKILVKILSQNPDNDNFYKE